MNGLKYQVALRVRGRFRGFGTRPPGCWSQGGTEAEALDNIRTAIEEYLAAVDGEPRGATIREVKVAAISRPSLVSRSPMHKLAGIPHDAAVRALQKVGFRILRAGKRVVLSDGQCIIAIPRHNPANANPWRGSSVTQCRHRSRLWTCFERGRLQVVHWIYSPDGAP
jgi:predicted RNase H-like HicB family nuclease